jgi:hypothetical protein
MSKFSWNKVGSHAAKALFVMLAFTACKKEIAEKDKAITVVEALGSKANQAEKFNTFYGPQVQVGDGKARSFYTVSHTGVPQELGIEMTSGAFSGIPEDHDLASFVLPLHQKASQATPFDHIYMNWNEHGHPPFALFGVPHFDFHFYTISVAQRMAIPAYIPPTSPDFILGPHDILPPLAYRPAGFVPTPGGEPQMGKHWADILHPVMPGTFTHTMIYGSYNGSLIFVEPMITRAFLQSGADLSMPYGQPTQFQESGTYYPTVYNIKDDASGKHYITLSGFVLR